MSVFTTEVRFICENAAGLSNSANYVDTQSIIELARPKIFNFSYPIFDEAYRKTLETKILYHFYTREIGFETVSLWKLKLQTKLNEIMPLFNQRYKSALIKFDPFNDTNLSHTHTKNSDKSINSEQNLNASNSSETDTTNNTNETQTDSATNTETRNLSNSTNTTNAGNDTPQGMVTNVTQLKYLSEYTENNANQTNTGTISNATSNNANNSSSNVLNEKISGNNSSDSTVNTGANEKETYQELLSGKSSGESYSTRLQQFRETFLNIDMEVIESLNTLFMGIWE